VWHAQNFPFLSQLLYYENGTRYDQLRILNDDYTLNYDKLAQEGLPWYAASQLLFKVSRTMYIGAAVTHFLLWHGKTVFKLFWDARTKEVDDPHYQRMKVYKEVPWYWYGGLFVACLAMALATSYTAHSGLPWWALIVALIFATLFTPVIGTVSHLKPGKPALTDLRASYIAQSATCPASKILFKCSAVLLFPESLWQTWCAFLFPSRHCVMLTISSRSTSHCTVTTQLVKR
jgi:hypothetical protein